MNHVFSRFLENEERYIVTEYLPQGGLKPFIQEKKDKLDLVDLIDM